MSEFEDNITRTLLYYEIFDHPLSLKELFLLSSQNSITFEAFGDNVAGLAAAKRVQFSEGYYSLPDAAKPLAEIRQTREALARRRMVVARFMAGIIRRSPFVRGVLLSGDLSKGVATPSSDIDYVIITAPGRLWICRLLLISFKKVFLFNSRKFFCLNYFLTEDRLELDDRNYYTATEIAHLKPLVNYPLFLKYLNANGWIKNYFPNYSPHDLTREWPHHRSVIQSCLEFPFIGGWVDSLDNAILVRMKSFWLKKYPQFASETFEKIFRCTRSESRAYAGNYAGRILDSYKAKLKERSLA